MACCIESCRWFAEFPSTLQSSFERLKDFERWSSSLTGQTLLVALNIGTFASQLFPSLPPIVGSCSFAGKRFVSLFFLKPMADDLKKTTQDLLATWHSGSRKEITITALKVTVKAIDLFLSIGLAAASFIGLVGNVRSFYAFAGAIGLPNFLFKIALELQDWRERDLLLTAYLQLSQEERRREEEKFNHFLSNQRIASDSFNSISGRAFRQMSAWDIHSARGVSLAEQLKHLQWHAGGDFLLLIMGHLSMGICAAYPNTALQGGVELAMSVLYWVKSVNR